MQGFDKTAMLVGVLVASACVLLVLFGQWVEKSKEAAYGVAVAVGVSGLLVAGTVAIFLITGG